MKESERLIAAKALIDSPEKWMRGDYSDKPYSNFKDACKFCSIGAVLKVRGESVADRDINDTSVYLARANSLSRSEYLGGIAEYNDNHTHAEVMQMFDKAIQLAQSEEN